jgi:hypothetical protein
MPRRCSGWAARILLRAESSPSRSTNPCRPAVWLQDGIPNLKRGCGMPTRHGYGFVTFHLHQPAEWWEFWAWPFHPGNVCDVLRETLQPAKVVLREPNWKWRQVQLERRLSSILKRRGVSYHRLSRNSLLAAGEALQALDVIDITDLFALTHWWFEAPGSEGGLDRVAALISRNERALDARHLDALTGAGVRFVYFDHDGDFTWLWLRYPGSGGAFAAYLVRNFLLNTRGKGYFAAVPDALAALNSVYFSPPDREFADALAAYSTQGVICAVREIAVGSHRVRLKCWRGHADLSGGSPGASFHQ